MARVCGNGFLCGRLYCIVLALDIIKCLHESALFYAAQSVNRAPRIICTSPFGTERLTMRETSIVETIHDIFLQNPSITSLLPPSQRGTIMTGASCHSPRAINVVVRECAAYTSINSSAPAFSHLSPTLLPPIQRQKERRKEGNTTHLEPPAQLPNRISKQLIRPRQHQHLLHRLLQAQPPIPRCRKRLIPRIALPAPEEDPRPIIPARGRHEIFLRVGSAAGPVGREGRPGAHEDEGFQRLGELDWGDLWVRV